MHMPELLNGHTMTVKCRLHPTRMGISLKVTDGTDLPSVTMTLPDSDDSISVDDWVLVHYPNGQSGVFYIKTLEQDKVTGDRNATLEHTFGLLRDSVAFGDLKPANLGGSKTSVNIVTCIRKLLTYQPSGQAWWQFDECDFADTAEGWHFTHQDIFSAITSTAESVPPSVWTFDQSSLPWKFSLKRQPTQATMEMRMNRNIASMKVSIDKSGMYTRIYPVGAKNLGIASINGGVPYLDMNTDVWGVIEHTMTDSDVSDAGLLKRTAQKALQYNSTPSVNISISGFDMSQSTGQDIDRIVLGRVCRVPLPKYGTVITQRIVELAWKDCILDPNGITVTLCNAKKNIQHVINKLSKSGSRKRVGCQLADHDNDIAVVTQLAGANADEITFIKGSRLWQNQNELISAIGTIGVMHDQLAAVQGSLLWQNQNQIIAAVGDISVLNGQIAEITGSNLWQDKDSIVSSVGKISAIDGKINAIQGSTIWQKRDNITAAVGMMEVGADGKLHITSGNGLVIDENGVSHGVYTDGNLTAGMIVSKINGGTVKIQSKNIELNGNTIAQLLDAQDVTVHSLGVAGSVVCEDISVQDISDCYINDILFSTHSHAITVNGGRVTFGQVVAQPQNFNIADTQFYKNGVSAARNAAKIEYYPDNVLISAGTYNATTKQVPITVTPINEAGQHIVVGGYTHNVTISGISGNPATIAYENGKNPSWASTGKSVTLPLQVVDSNGASLLKQNFSVNTTTAYNRGWNGAVIEYKPDTVYVSPNTPTWDAATKKLSTTVYPRNEAGENIVASGFIVKINGQAAYDAGAATANVSSVVGESVSYSHSNTRLALTAAAKNSSGTVLKRNNIYLSTKNVYQYSEWTTAKPSDMTGWTEVNVFNGLNGSQTKFEKCLKIVVTDYRGNTTKVYDSTQVADFYIGRTQITANTTKRYYKPSVCDFNNVAIM